MKNSTILPSSLSFLTDLAKNNNREWFAENKQTYLDAQANIIAFVDRLIQLMSAHDTLENTSSKKSVYRIYNDVRFSKDKSPYKPRFAFGFQRATKLKRGGYFVNIQPGNNFLACGFFSPNPEDLKRIRNDIERNPSEWHDILNSKHFLQNFVELAGNKVPTFPKGFPKDHKAIDLIRHKQFILRHTFTDQEVTAPEFTKKLNDMFKTARPFLDHMSLVLTTDLNGEINV